MYVAKVSESLCRHAILAKQSVEFKPRYFIHYKNMSVKCCLYIVLKYKRQSKNDPDVFAFYKQRPTKKKK